MAMPCKAPAIALLNIGLRIVQYTCIWYLKILNYHLNYCGLTC